MEWSKKINNKKYFLGYIIASAFCIYSGRYSWKDILLLKMVLIASVINQFLMFKTIVSAFNKILNPITKNQGFEGFAFAAQIFTKLLVLVGIFYVTAIHAKYLLLTSLIIYTFQLIIFILSIKRK